MILACNIESDVIFLGEIFDLLAIIIANMGRAKSGKKIIRLLKILLILGLLKTEKLINPIKVARK